MQSMTQRTVDMKCTEQMLKEGADKGSVTCVKGALRQKFSRHLTARADRS